MEEFVQIIRQSFFQGCESFDFSKQLNLLITGTADYLARIWNPYVTKRNIAVLEGHHSAVIDVKINDRLGQCYTYAKDAVRTNPFLGHRTVELVSFLDCQSLGFERIHLFTNDNSSVSNNVERKNTDVRHVSDGSLFEYEQSDCRIGNARSFDSRMQRLSLFNEIRSRRN